VLALLLLLVVRVVLTWLMIKKVVAMVAVVVLVRAEGFFRVSWPMSHRTYTFRGQRTITHIRQTLRAQAWKVTCEPATTSLEKLVRSVSVPSDLPDW
jgi:hypothetical protein